MKLNLPSPPVESIERAAASLTALATHGRFGTARLRDARPEQLSLSVPHEVFTMDLATLRTRPTHVQARPAAWRYMLEVDTRIVATAEMARQDEFLHVNGGPEVSGTIRAMSIAEALGTDEPAELRVLSIPGLYFLAVWLKPINARNEEEDVLIPIAPTTSGVDANRAYPAPRLLEILSEHALVG